MLTDKKVSFSPSRLTWRTFALSTLVWGSYLVLQLVVMGTTSSFGPGVVPQILGYFLAIAVATPPLFALSAARAARLHGGYRLWAGLVWFALAFAVAHAVVLHLVAASASMSALPMAILSAWLHFVPVAFAGVVVAQRAAARSRERELTDAQLRALRARLQPHFLFNTLHAISVVSRSDAETATRMLTLLGDLLRQTLRERSDQLVSLAEERDLLQPYLEIQSLRFQDRLRFEVDLPASVLGAAVPDLMLQPLVENALQHGLERRPDGGTVRIAARRWGDRLEILVHDDGAGLQESAAAPGIGLGTTRARLHALFGDRASVELAADPSGGTTATIVLPFREVGHAA